MNSPTPRTRQVRRGVGLTWTTVLMTFAFLAPQGPAYADNCSLFINPVDCANTAWTTGLAAMLAAMLAALAALLSSEGTQEEENEDEKKCEVLAVKVWINAFIPGELGSVTLPVPGEPGKTMLKVPWWAPGKCFYTDHRGYSADLDASTRMQQIVMLDVKSARIWSEARCGTTIEVFCDDGRVRQTGLAPTTGMRMVNISHPAPSVHTCELIGSAANPLVSGAPSIDYHGFLSHRHRGGSRSRRRLDARKGTGGLHGRS